ncbi:hypothetical protein [Saprospira grandis]|uniref:hypothetical protein n=1 Tax=Saprospira grandis TaxID=1008 RepID=UPI0002D6C5CB|nr:hypothetical protein [Saprospira grandis]
MFKAVEDFNPLRTIDVEWGCCMAAGFNLQPQLAGGEAAAGLGACKGAAQRQTKGEARRAEQTCEP